MYGISRAPCEAGTKWDRWQVLDQTISREKVFRKTDELRTDEMKSLSKLTGSGLVICGFLSDLTKLLLTQIKSPPSQTQTHGRSPEIADERLPAEAEQDDTHLPASALILEISVPSAPLRATPLFSVLPASDGTV